MNEERELPDQLTAELNQLRERIKILESAMAERDALIEKLSISKTHLDSIVENIPDMIFVKDADELRFVRFNKAGEELLGYSRDLLIGKSDYDLFPRHEADFFNRKDREVLNSKQLVDIPEETIQTRYRGERVLHTKKIPILDENGTPRYLLGISEDITERRRSEAERALLATVVEQAEENVLIADERRTILYINPAFERSSGYRCEELKGKKLRDLRSTRHDQAFYQNMKEVLDRGEVWMGVIINRGKDGTEFEIEGTISPIRDTSGAITHFVAVGRNMSRFRKLERELYQAQKMEAVGTLAGGIAHDFNNILTAISGYTELALFKAPEDETVRYSLEQVLKAGQRARDLVKQILTFTRQQNHERMPVPVAAVLDDALKLLRSALPATIEMRREVAIAPEESVVMADPTQIHQVVMNLCTNAAHAMRTHGGLLQLSLTRVEVGPGAGSPDLELQPGSYVQLTVTDTGHGMEAAVLQRIFEPYFTTKAQGEGTGLGLAVVLGIVKKYGGTVTVDSEPGQGSTFTVFLPRREIELAAEPETAIQPPTGNERILFVDDEKALVELGQEMLESLGYQVTVKTRSRKALEAFRAEPDAFDLVITDMTMPGLTGSELAMELLKIRPDIPIILCTGFSELINEQQAKAVGIREFVMKPYVVTSLANAIRKALDENP